MSNDETTATPRTNDVFTAAKESAMAAKTGTVPQMQQQYQLPTENVPLASNGKVYPEQHPLNGKSSVEIRAMTARDEDILTSRALVKNGTVISQLLRSCLTDKRIDPGSMLSGDRNAVMVAIRITGYGREYEVEVGCPNPDCEEKSDFTFDLAQLPVNRLLLDPAEPGQNLFAYQLPSGKQLLWRFMTGRDEEELTQSQNARKKAKMQATDGGLVTSRMTRMIVAIDGERDRNRIATIVPNLPAYDSRSFRQFVEEHEPGLEMLGMFTCPHCGESAEVDVPFGASFFWPTAKKS